MLCITRFNIEGQTFIVAFNLDAERTGLEMIQCQVFGFLIDLGLFCGRALYSFWCSNPVEE